MFEFARQLKVMEDTEDGLDDLHGFGGALAVLSLARAEATLVAEECLSVAWICVCSSI